MVINHNISAMNTYRQLSVNTMFGSRSLEKLSSGLRINRAGDDAAGLAISEKMRGQIKGLTMAAKNAQDGISLIQTAEGALNETHSILQRMRELAVQAATDTNTADDRAKIQVEMDQLAHEITRISNTTEFNTQNLMAGGLNNIFHIGANQGQNVGLKIAAMDAHSLGVAASKIETTVASISNGITGIDSVTENLGVGAELDITVTDAGSTVEQGTVAGAVEMVADDSYTGTENKRFTIELVSVQGGSGEVDTIRFSTDEGNTWSNAIAHDGSGKFALGDGVEITVATDTDNAADQAATIDVTPRSATLQLQNDAEPLGSSVTVYGNQTSVVVGDSVTNRTAHVTFDFEDLASGQVTINQSLDESTAATVDAQGNIVTDAKVMAGINVSTQGAADKAITVINNALESVSAERSKLGAMQNRLDHTINNLTTASENLQAAESRIRDVDYAEAA
ncbi:MAG: flagellin [bacterium]|jgi:flagellin|nr:flagellin [Bacillota bacterium]